MALSGVVRLTTVEVVAEQILPGAIARLHVQSPGITIDVLSESRAFNLSRREADLAIRMTRFDGSDLISRRIGMVASALYASEGYLAQFGVPQDGGPHSVVTVLEDQLHLPEARWLAEQLPRARVALRTNNRNGQLAAVRAGLGLGCLPCVLADPVPGLRRLTSPDPAPMREVWLGVHADLRHMPRIRAVIDVLDHAFAQARTRLFSEIGPPLA